MILFLNGKMEHRLILDSRYLTRLIKIYFKGIAFCVGFYGICDNCLVRLVGAIACMLNSSF